YFFSINRSLQFMKQQQKIVVAITGATGCIYAKNMLETLTQLKDQWWAVDVVMTENAKQVWEREHGGGSFETYPYRFFHTQDFLAPFASGSGKYDTMIVIPCSMGVLGRIAGGIPNDLITRAADVILKECRKLLLVVRETPYNLIHIRNMDT